MQAQMWHATENRSFRRINICMVLASANKCANLQNSLPELLTTEWVLSRSGSAALLCSVAAVVHPKQMLRSRPKGRSE